MEGEREKPGNYRPVNLTSVVGKLLESIFKVKVIEHFEKFELIRESQHGFVEDTRANRPLACAAVNVSTGEPGGSYYNGKMECPVCGDQFPELVIQQHAWDCDGSKLHANENPEEEAGEGDCPLCSHYFPADQIVQHAAFCNGPSYRQAQDRWISSYQQAQDRESPSYRQAQDRRISSEDASSTEQLFWSYINGREPVITGAAAGDEGPGRVLSSRGTEGGSVLDLEKAIEYLGKLEQRLIQDPEFKQVFGPLLKNPNPLHILQSLSNAIFRKSVTAGAKGAAPVFLFFQLAKLFLPTILQSESFAVFKKWAEVFILEVVVPWISQMGGWQAVLCALGALLASGLLLGLTMLLMTSNSNK
ncbi:uncharacterized protein [Heptranchias perlo]|uniref:uncharacterized protein isoform X3 n=1 Tax=Heptranchias perlo TaxID=212740 RepID=UPI00355961E8